MENNNNKLENTIEDTGADKDIRLSPPKIELRDMLNKDQQILSAYIKQEGELFKGGEQIRPKDQGTLQDELESFYVHILTYIPDENISYEEYKEETLELMDSLDFLLEEQNFDDLRNSLLTYKVMLSSDSIDDHTEHIIRRETLQENLQKVINKVSSSSS